MLDTMKLSSSFVILLLTVFGDANAKGPCSTAVCSSCEKLVSLTSKVNESLKNSHNLNNYSKWCVNSNFGDDKQMCEFLLNNIESSLSKVNTKHFCHGINACCSNNASTNNELIGIKAPNPGYSPTECEFCLNTLTHVKEIVSSPETEREMKLVMSSFCAYLKELKNECLKFVAKELDMVFQFIRDQLDPRQFCIEAQACPPRNYLPDSGRGKIVPPMVPFLTQKQESLIDSLQYICNGLDITLEKCSVLIRKVNDTFEALKEDSTSVSNCSLRENIVKSDRKYKSNGFRSLCSKCLQVTRFIEDKLSSYQTEEEIAELIKNDICGLLPNPTLKETCQSFMIEYGDSFVYKLALKVFDPDFVCSKEFRICPKVIKERFSSVGLSSIKSVNSGLCDICNDIVTTLESHASATFPGNSIDKKMVDEICLKFESVERTEKCKVILDTFGSHLVQMVGFNDAAKICSVLDICHNNNSHLLGKEKCTFGPVYWCHSPDHANACKATNYCEKNVWKAGFNGGGTPQCALCHLIVHVIGKQLEKNRTEAEIEAVLDGVCQKIYKDQTKLEQCEKRVAKNIKRFISLVSQGVAPEVICTIFGFCLPGDTSFLEKQRISCPICESFINNALRLVSNNSTRADIYKALEHACDPLPENHKQVCTFYVKLYETKLIELIDDGKTAYQICQEIGLCTSIGLAPQMKNDDTECILCKHVFEFIFSYLQTNQTQEAINYALDKVCDEIFPSSHKKSCRNFVDAYTSQIIDIVLQTTDPKEACILLNICKQSNLPSGSNGAIPLKKLGPKASVGKLSYY